MDHPISVSFVRWIVLLPAAGAAINFILGATIQRKFGKRAISLVGCGVVIIAFLLAARVFLTMTALAPDHRFMLDRLWNWIDVGGLNLQIAFWLDPLSMVMALIVTGVGGLIHIYSIVYMDDDESYWRFLCTLNVVTLPKAVPVVASMMWLVILLCGGGGRSRFLLICRL